MDNFRIKLGFKINGIIMSKEGSITAKISKLFKKEKIALQEKVLNYYIELYFIEYNLAFAIDERGHLDRSEEEEQLRENKIKEILGCEFARINPDKEMFDVFDEIGKIYGSIDEIKGKRKNKSIDKIEEKHKKFVDEIEEKHKKIVDKIKKQNKKSIKQNQKNICTLATCLKYSFKKYCYHYKNTLTYCLKCNNNKSNIGSKK